MKKLLLAFFLVLSVFTVSESLQAQRGSIEGEVRSASEEVDKTIRIIVQFVFIISFGLGLALIIPPSTRRAGAALLVGVLMALIVFTAFTDYFPTLSGPLKEIVGGKDSKMSDFFAPKS